MKSDPKECLYCQNNETLHNLMIEIAQLSVSRVFLFKEQTYRGRFPFIQQITAIAPVIIPEDSDWIFGTKE